MGAVVALSGQVIVASTKRGDRKHQTALEFEKRVGNEKREALLAVIRWAKGIQKKTTPNTDPLRSYHPLTNVLVFAVTHPMELDEEVTAYTGKDVQAKYEVLNNLLSNALATPYQMLVWQIKAYDDEYSASMEARAQALAAQDESEYDKHADIAAVMKAGTSASHALGLREQVEGSLKLTLDPDRLHRLAVELIAVARKDMRGGG
ncbi:MAG: hypothetical protein HYZ38_26630 [Mycobacterium sp.]|nr:hypothetical protein [Mycobacterium sp.]